MAETPNVMPQLHMPLQSGSDRVLRAMRRSYRSARFLGILDRVRQAIPNAAISTDIIVGFPGETEEDFQATLDVVRARFAGAFTFQYSPGPGRRPPRSSRATGGHADQPATAGPAGGQEPGDSRTPPANRTESTPPPPRTRPAPVGAPAPLPAESGCVL